MSISDDEGWVRAAARRRPRGGVSPRSYPPEAADADAYSDTDSFEVLSLAEAERYEDEGLSYCNSAGVRFLAEARTF